jgi:hypothetical protein
LPLYGLTSDEIFWYIDDGISFHLLDIGMLANFNIAGDMF